MKPDFIKDTQFPEPVDPNPADSLVPFPDSDPLIDDPSLLEGTDPETSSPVIRTPHPANTEPLSDPVDDYPEDETVETDERRRREARIMAQVDCFLGRVKTVYYDDASGNQIEGAKQMIVVERVDAHWDGTTNVVAPSLVSTPQAQGVNGISCKPFPLRSDQELYHVEVGDVVSVLQGADGRHWFLCDELPFIGVVVAWDKANIDEDNTGGVSAGMGLKVRQQIMTNAPAGQLVSLADKEIEPDEWVDGTAYLIDDVVKWETADPPAVNYRCHTANTSQEPPNGSYWEADISVTIHRNVNVIKHATMTSGYRVGDEVLVFRRGMYLFALPGRQTFPAEVKTAGPGSEGNYSDERYWVQEINITGNDYGGGANSWDLAGSQGNTSRTPPNSLDGYAGRWVTAINLAERPEGTHELAADTVVEVQIWEDQGYDIYTFTHAEPYIDEFKVRCSSTDDTEEYLEDKVLADLTWVEVVTENPDDPNDPPDPGNENLRINHIGPDNDGADEGKRYLEIDGFFTAGINAHAYLGTSGAPTCLCVIDGIRVDSKGHIFAVDTNTTAGSHTWVDWSEGSFS